MPAIEDHDHRHHFQVLLNRKEMNCVRRGLARLAMSTDGDEAEFVRHMLTLLDVYVAKRLDEVYADTKQIQIGHGAMPEPMRLS